MKNLTRVLLGLSLLVPVTSFAQDTIGSAGKSASGKKGSKVTKAHKGGKKAKKAASGNTSTPTPK
jgi:hypothetical protein